MTDAGDPPQQAGRNWLFIFDVGNVFVTLDLAARQAGLARGTQSSPEGERATLLANANRAFRLGQMAEADYIEQVTAIYGLSPDDIYRAEAAFLPATDARMVDLVPRLRRDYRVVGLSNTNGIHWRHIEAELLPSDFFAARYLSHEMGVEKPGAEIYRQTVEAEAADLSNIVFVDDTLANIETARALGWRHCIHHTDAGETIAAIGRILAV